MNLNPPVPQASSTHVFIVRIWCESAEPGPGGEWRGSIEHAATHEKRYFLEVEALSTFIRSQAGWPAECQAEAPPAASLDTRQPEGGHVIQ